jgi:copper chaperone CopZ
VCPLLDTILTSFIGFIHFSKQAILSPWLGPDADNEAIQLGLTTLRTWWQHRRKGESGSAIAALGTEKMKGVVEGYTRHFFTLAHCIVVNDRVQPPRGLLSRMKDLEKKRAKQNKTTVRPATVNEVLDSLDAVSAIRADLSDPNLTPLEKLHLAQRRQMETSSNLNAVGSGGFDGGGITGVSAPILHQAMTGKCIPGKVDLPGVLEAVNHQATQLAHRGFTPNEVGSNSAVGMANGPDGQPYYGDPHTTPVVFVSSTGDIQIAMKVDGITCAHCVKIVETVLRGCNGNKSPIAGLLDAAADEHLGRVILKIDEAAAAKRIAFEASRNLSMVGYTAEPLSMSIVGSGADPVSHADLGALATAFEVVAATEPTDVFDWTIPCTCPDNGIVRGDCARYVVACVFVLQEHCTGTLILTFCIL